MAHDHALHAHAHDHDHHHGHDQPDAHAHGIWTRDHVFLGHGHAKAQARAKWAAILTAVFVVVEIAGGVLFQSMALLADGVHMAPDLAALLLAAGAYWLAHRHAGNTRFSFGSGKFGDLAAFASAIILGLTAILVAAESVQRLMAPVKVEYGPALLVAVLGFAVNLGCALILRDGHHGHGHAHAHDRDNNMRAAYLHMVADAATSLLAIASLAAGYWYGLGILDPLCGLVGAGVIAFWSYGLIRDSAMVLLDADSDPSLSREISGFLEGELNARISDLHLWRVGPGHHSLIVSMVAPAATTAEKVKTALRGRYPDLSHVTVDVAVCADCT